MSVKGTIQCRVLMAGLNRSGGASFTCAQYKYAREPVTATAVEVPPSSAPPTRPIRSRSLCHSPPPPPPPPHSLSVCRSLSSHLRRWCRLHCATSGHLCATARGQIGTDAPSVESREAAADTLPCLRLLHTWPSISSAKPSIATSTRSPLSRSLTKEEKSRQVCKRLPLQHQGRNKDFPFV